MSIKHLANIVAAHMRDGKEPPPADVYDEEKFPFGVAAGNNKWIARCCPTCGKSPSDTPRGPSFLFRDQLSAWEYTISGTCQDCQDELFASPDDNN